MLTLLILLLMLGGVAAWISGRWSRTWPRWISMGTALLHIIILLVLWVHDLYRTEPGTAWLEETRRVWVPQLGITYHLAIDGLSLLLVLLSNFLGILAIAEHPQLEQKARIQSMCTRRESPAPRKRSLLESQG